MKKYGTSSLSMLFYCGFLYFNLFSNSVLAQPTQEQIFEINASIVQVNAEFRNGSKGTGSGVVIAENYVITNCHVLADAVGVNVAKVRDNYAPVALQADWKHDLCLLRFENLPLKSVPMKASAKLQNEQEIFLIGYPNNAQVPQTSYGFVTALYPYDGSLVIRSSASFAQGSSGGALFDEDFNLVGITTFKSPGRLHPYFYSLPIEWIQNLFNVPEVKDLHATENPFWNYPEEERPFFMQIVIPYQQNQWPQLLKIATAWRDKEPQNSSAWFYLGVAEYHQENPRQGLLDIQKSISLNPKNVDAYAQLAQIAIEAGDKVEAQRLVGIIDAIDPEQAEDLTTHVSAMQ